VSAEKSAESEALKVKCGLRGCRLLGCRKLLRGNDEKKHMEGRNIGNIWMWWCTSLECGKQT